MFEKSSARSHVATFDAIADGMQKMNANWRVVVPLFIMLGILVNLSILLLGIGLIWTLPMVYAASGICFRDAYGLRNKK